MGGGCARFNRAVSVVAISVSCLFIVLMSIMVKYYPMCSHILGVNVACVSHKLTMNF